MKLCWWGKGVAPHYSHMDVEVWVLHSGSVDTLIGEEHLIITGCRWGVRLPTTPPPLLPQRGGGSVPHYSPRGLYQHHGVSSSHSAFSDTNPTKILGCPARLSFSWSFGQKEQDFIGAFQISFVAASGLSALLESSLGYIRQKKEKKKEPRELGSKSPQLVYLLVSYLCCVNNIQAFQLYLVGGIWKNISTLSFQKQKSVSYFFI